MAADTKIGGALTLHGPKLVRMPDGGMAAGAGDCAPIAAFLEWLQKGQKGKRPAVKEVDIIWVRGDGSVYTITEQWPPVRVTAPVTCGTGAMAAMAGLKLGLSVKAAVELACEIDPASGGPVETMELLKK